MVKFLKEKLSDIRKRCQGLKGIYFKKQKTKTLILLIILSSTFCLDTFLSDDVVQIETPAFETTQDEIWLEQSIIGNRKMNLSNNFSKRQKVFEQFSAYYLPEKKKNDRTSDFETEIGNLVNGYPIEEMVPFISDFDRRIAGLVIGIAKKESNWGKHAPFKNGDNCFNYWGYKGSGSKGTIMGYACFGSAEEAVKIIGARIKRLVDKKMDTPSELIVWKCGSSCDWDNPKNVAKWITDVSVYYNQIAYIK